MTGNGLYVIYALAILPVLDRVRALAWTRAVMKGMGPAVIGLLAVSLFRLAPYALPDRIAMAMFVLTLLVLVAGRLSAFKAMLGGAVLGLLRIRLFSIPGG